MDIASPSPVSHAPNRRYLVCVDNRPECKVAVRLACLKVAARGGSITLLHIIPPADFQTLGAIADRMRVERMREGEALLEAFCNEAQQLFHLTPDTALLEGSAGDAIIEKAMSDTDIIMVVLGVAHRHHSGRGKLAAWLGGQLGDTLLVPLLMVPGNLTEQQLSTLI